MSDTLVNVNGCFRCKKLIGDLRAEGKTHMHDGYEQCSFCNADIDLFWLNVTKMSFQESRPVTMEMARRAAREIGGF
jgi:hypothetical protein